MTSQVQQRRTGRGLLVVGVGRSGTSIATRLASGLGLRLPNAADLMPGNPSNPDGLSLAAHLDPAELDEGASFVLDVDGEAFTLAISGDGVAATDGADPDCTATVAGRLRDFFATARGQTTASQRITTTGDRAAANKLVDAMTGAMAHVKGKA